MIPINNDQTNRTPINMAASSLGTLGSEIIYRGIGNEFT